MIFLTGGTATTNERVRLTTNGYVGIGTPSPQAYLHVNNSTTGTGSFPLLQLTTGFTGATANDGFTIGLENNTTAYNVQFKTKETGNIEFYGGNNEAMYIKSTGNVGIGFGASTPNSTLQVAGSVSFAIVTQTAATYAVSSTDATVLCNRSSAMTVTLPTAVGISGRIYTVKNINTNTGSSVTINTTSSQTIDSYGTAVGLSYMGNTGFYTSYTFQSNGSNWYILSGH